MTPIPGPLHPWRRALLAALLPLCFVAQQVWVPVHLALCEHLREHADGVHGAIAIAADHDASEHTHVHGDHAHGADHDADCDEGPHAPHPADDHDDEVSELAVTPQASHAPLALVPVERTCVVHLLPAQAGPAAAAEGPRAPPLRSGAPPRAPPLSIEA